MQFPRVYSIRIRTFYNCGESRICVKMMLSIAAFDLLFHEHACVLKTIVSIGYWYEHFNVHSSILFMMFDYFIWCKPLHRIILILLVSTAPCPVFSLFSLHILVWFFIYRYIFSEHKHPKITEAWTSLKLMWSFILNWTSLINTYCARTVSNI